MSDGAKSSDPASDGGPRWALVTGAARRIGAATARTLHRRGCQVIVHYNGSAAAAADLVADLNGQRAESAYSIDADLSDFRAIDRLAAFVKQHTRRLDLLVNNASRFYPTRVGDTTTEAWQGLFDTNLRGPFLLTQALVSELRAARGAVINLIDIYAERPLAGHPAYCASKAGLAMLTRSLALELAPEVRVNGVSPGAILWPEGGDDAEHRKRILSRVPMQTSGEPADIAEAVAWLGLDAPYVTGQVLAVDGGRSLNV